MACHAGVVVRLVVQCWCQRSRDGFMLLSYGEHFGVDGCT